MNRDLKDMINKIIPRFYTHYEFIWNRFFIFKGQLIRRITLLYRLKTI